MTDIRTIRVGGEVYALPFIGATEHLVTVRVDVSALTADEVDADGYIKPGVPLGRDGTLVGISPDFVYGCVFAPERVADDNTNLAGVTDDRDVTLLVIGIVNRDALEDILGRVLTADEIAGFERAGSKLVLTNS